MITTRFDGTSTADDVVRGVDLTGRQALVTGASSGLGAETARALAAAGATVTLAVRNVEAGTATAADIAAATGRARPQVRPLDLADPGSVAAFLGQWSAPLDILVNNAGVVTAGLQRTAQGWELQFATNHLGPFALALGLQDALTSAGGARVVAVSSSGHLFSPVVFDDLHYAFRPYDPMSAYGQSKTAGVLFAVAASARWAERGITVNALNPGAIATNLQRHVGGQLKTPVERQKSVQQGAATSVLLATSPQLEGVGGRYFEDCNEAEPVTSRNAEATGVATYALDPSNADRLWAVSSELIRAASDGLR